MKAFLIDSLVIAWRDIIRSTREKSRLFSSIVRPVIWLFLLGSGLRGSFSQMPGGYTYTQYIFPGMLAMNVLFASVQSGTTIIWDREFGFLKEILVSPVSRSSIVFGKTISGAVVATMQGLIVLALFPFVGLRLSFFQIIICAAALFMIALSITSLGILIASRMTSFEGFGSINNFIVMPLFFLSGAMYPVNKAPYWLKPFIMANPLSYSVNLLRGIILGTEGNFFIDIAVIAAFLLTVFSIATYIFYTDRR